MSSKINSRSKGARGELELANLLKEDYAIPASRTAQHCGKVIGKADVEVTEGVLSNYHMEVKRTEALSLWKAIDQALRDSAKTGKEPVVVHRKNGKPWVVVLTLEKFLEILGYEKIKKENQIQ